MVIVLLMASCHKTMLVFDLSFPLVKRNPRFRIWEIELGLRLNPFAEKDIRDSSFRRSPEDDSIPALRELAPIMNTINSLHLLS